MEEQPAELGLHTPVPVEGCCEPFALDVGGKVLVDTPSNKITAKYHCPHHQDHQPHWSS